MQDRIKYRAWSKDHNYFIIHYEEDRTVSLSALEGLLKIDSVQLIPSVGKRDVKNKLIFEGDILNICFKSSGGEWCQSFKKIVKYDKKQALFYIKDYGLFNEKDTYEIIGNVYEDQELFKNFGE